MLKIMGKSQASIEQMRAYIRKMNPKVSDSVIKMIPLYITEGAAEGVRGDIAFAQSCLETGNFTFDGSAVTLDQNNFCGMGVTKTGMKGNSFKKPAEGIRAQIQHLQAYACTDRLKRHYDASRKNCPRRIQAEGRWPEFVKKTAAYMKGTTTVNNTSTTKSTVTLTDKIETQFPVIQKGSKGIAVSMLQAMLGVKVDGDFGNDTDTSLKAFQKNVKLTADGICGADTWTKVIEHMKANTK